MELSIEEKAKAYDEAIERAKDFMNGEVHYALKKGENIMCWVFPQLRESDDERIRKALMQNLKERFGTKGNMGEGLDMPDVLAWFEKQGEPTEINPNEFCLRLDRLLKQFESLSNEEFVSTLSFYLNVFQNNGTYKETVHYELEEFAKIVRGNLSGISKTVQELFEAKYLQLTGNKMYGGYKD